MKLYKYKERKAARLVKQANQEFGKVIFDHGDDLSLGEIKLDHFGKKIAQQHRVSRSGDKYLIKSK